MFLHLHHNFKNQSYDSSRRTLREGIEFLLDLFKPSSQGAAETISDRTAHQSPHNAKLVVEPAKEVDMLSGINVTFHNGTVVTIKKGSAKSVMQLMKLYEKEDLLCLD